MPPFASGPYERLHPHPAQVLAAAGDGATSVLPRRVRVTQTLVVDADAVPEGTGDAVRILPGDGVLPLHQALRDLKAIGYTRTLSLELFNEELWKKDPREVSELGLRKMREGVEKALA